VQLDGENKLEEQAIYNELMINNIHEELEHQEECLRQYIDLNQQYENPSNQNIEKNFTNKSK